MNGWQIAMLVGGVVIVLCIVGVALLVRGINRSPT